MALLDVRPRAGYLFLGIMLGHILLISAQINSRGGGSVLEAMTFGVVAEVQRSISSGFSSVRRVWGGYADLRNVQLQNEELVRQLHEAQIAVQEQRALADRTRSLEQLLDLRDRSNLTTIAAEIIAAGASPDFRTVTIDKGTRDGLGADMAALAPAGVVGRVVIPSARASKIQLLVDRNAAAGALIERSRAQGVATGVGEELLTLEYVSEIADVIVGDLVVTSGIDGIYPKGYVIGRVESVDKNGGAYKKISVRPAVDFRSLEEVLVVTTPTPARELGQGSAE